MGYPKSVIARWRNGHTPKGVSAETALQALTTMHKAHGRLDPETIVDESRPEDAPLHPAFEWDDSKAAHEHRLHQARHIVRSVVIVREESKDEPAVPAFVHVNLADGNVRGYQPVHVVVSRPDWLTIAMSDLLAKMQSAERSVEALRQAAGSVPAAKKRVDVVAKAVTDAADVARKMRKETVKEGVTS